MSLMVSSCAGVVGPENRQGASKWNSLLSGGPGCFCGFLFSFCLAHFESSSQVFFPHNFFRVISFQKFPVT